MELKEITEFRKRFGDRIPDNVLGLLYERYRDSINHNVGSELIRDVLFAISTIINEIAEGKKERIAELEQYKKIGDKWNGIIKKHGKRIEDNYESNLLSFDQKIVLLRWLSKERLREASRTFINLNRFCHAYNSEVGKALRKDVESNVNGGVKAIWESKSNGELVSYNAYKIIDSNWNTKIKSHKEVKEAIQTIINRRRK